MQIHASRRNKVPLPKVEELTPPVSNTDVKIDTPNEGIVNHSNVVVQPQRNIVMDNERAPSEFMLKYAEGAPWPVTWYRNLGGLNDLKKFFDYDTENPTQQLERVYDIPILVLSAIDPSQDSESKSFDVNGEGTLPLGFPVNENDFFTANIGQGKVGLFYVTDSYRLSYDKKGICRATYKMVSYLNEKHLNALEKCVVRDFYWEADKVGLGNSALLTPTEHMRWVSIREAMEEIKECYVDIFYDQLTRTLIVPEQDRPIYDTFFIDFVRGIGFSKYPNEISLYNLDPIKPKTLFTVWRAIKELSNRNRKFLIKEMGYYPSTVFRRSERMNTLYYSNMKGAIMCPNQMGQNKGLKLNTSKDFVETPYNGNRTELVGLPLFKAFSLSPYVLSDNFYAGNFGSVLEYGIDSMLSKKPFDQELALVLANNVYDLPKLEMFYFMPLVYTLLSYSRGLQ